MTGGLQGRESAPGPSRGVHTPVMLREVLAALSPRGGAIYVETILDAADCRVSGRVRARDHQG